MVFEIKEMKVALYASVSSVNRDVSGRYLGMMFAIKDMKLALYALVSSVDRDVYICEQHLPHFTPL